MKSEGHLNITTDDIHNDLRESELTDSAYNNDNRQRTSRHQANAMMQSSKFKPIKCWGCGRNHHLRNCPTTSQEDRQRLWEEFRTKHPRNQPTNNIKTQTNTNRSPPSDSTPTANSVNHNSNSSSAHTDSATAGKAPPLTPSSNINRSEVTMSKRKNISGIAYATVHHANMAIPRPSETYPNINIQDHLPTYLKVAPTISSKEIRGDATETNATKGNSFDTNSIEGGGINSVTQTNQETTMHSRQPIENLTEIMETKQIQGNNENEANHNAIDEDEISDTDTTYCNDDEYEEMYDDRDDSSAPPLLVRRSARQRQPTNRFTFNAHAASTPDLSWIPQELTLTVENAYNIEVENSIDTTQMNPNELLPAPDNWKQIMKLPPHIKKVWIKSFVTEIKELLRKGTVERETPNEDDPIIPVTAKHRVKLTSDGLVEKLKTRIALRGDLMRENVFVPDTWCPIAGFKALKIFLAFAAECKQRIYQLDYVAAFLQADVIGRKFTIFPKGWIELLTDYPELHQWLGVPLRLRKSLYGDRVANLAWDETQSQWLTSEEIGFTRLPSEGSIYIKRTDIGFIVVLNAVDDQLYFATDKSIKEWFEKATRTRFDVQFMGQATWYLQSRITQHPDYSITLDQSRYAALIIQRYLNNTSDANITEQMKLKYATPIPTTTTFTKEDCSATYSEVSKIQQEYGFEYAAVVGSLIYLMNTYIKLNYAIRKLARFMQYPGRRHFKTLLHLLRHLQCYRRNGGIKFYSNMTESPLHHYLISSKNETHRLSPIICFADASFQDCPDTSRSTGGYLIFVQGGVVDVTSMMPQLIAYSTCEAEYCTGALAAMATTYIKKIYNELHGLDSDHNITIPIGMDSQSAINTAQSNKETQRTKHIQRRYHFLRLAVATSQIVLFKVDGTTNCANSLTKPLSAEQLAIETKIYEVEVDP
jgi:hypothetical protein